MCVVRVLELLDLLDVVEAIPLLRWRCLDEVDEVKEREDIL